MTIKSSTVAPRLQTPYVQETCCCYLPVLLASHARMEKVRKSTCDMLLLWQEKHTIRDLLALNFRMFTFRFLCLFMSGSLLDRSSSSLPAAIFEFSNPGVILEHCQWLP